MSTSERISDLVRRYAEGPGLLEEAVAGIAEEEVRFRPGPEHWNIHENVIHVADTDLVGAVRTESGPQTLEWIVDHLADHVHYHLRTIAKRRRQYAEARR